MGTEAGASSGTDGSSKGSHEVVGRTEAKVQQKRNSNLQTEAARTGSPQKPHHGM